MKYGARKFNQKSYNENDEEAKKIFKNYIIKKGHKIINDKENFYHDIVTEKNGKLFYFEVEIKRNYSFTVRESFKFPTVSFLGRKERLHKIHEYKYIIICKETNWAVGCDSKDIFKEEYVEFRHINTSDRKGLDKLYRVPRDICKFFDLN